MKDSKETNSCKTFVTKGLSQRKKLYNNGAEKLDTNAILTKIHT